MQEKPPRRHTAPLALAAAGILFTLLAVADKVFGLVQHPRVLAALAYTCLAALLVWACVCGVQFRSTRSKRLSFYAGFLILNVLTATFLFAWRGSADPTPLLLNARLNEGDALLNSGRKDEAHLIYRDAYRRYPNSFPVLMRMGAVNYQVGDFERAERYFSRALELAPPADRWRALNDLGQSLWKLHRPEEAIEHYLRARREGMPDAKPELIEWHYRLAWAYFDVKEYDKAVEHYQAVALYGEKYAAASYYNIACALAQKLAGRPPGDRTTLATEAVDSLREAWNLTEPDEKDAFRDGLLGEPDQRDPELEPLRGTASFQSFLEELKAA